MRKGEEDMSPAECAAAAALRREEEYAREMAEADAAADNDAVLWKEKVGRDRCKGNGKRKQTDADDDAESMKSRTSSIRSLKGILRNKLERASNKFERTRDKLRKKAKFDKLDSGPGVERKRESDVPLMSGGLGAESERGNVKDGLDAHKDKVREAKRKTKRRNRTERRHTRRESRRERRRDRHGERSESRSGSEESNHESYHISYGPVGACGCTVM